MSNSIGGSGGAKAPSLSSTIQNNTTRDKKIKELQNALKGQVTPVTITAIKNLYISVLNLQSSQQGNSTQEAFKAMTRQVMTCINKNQNQTGSTLLATMLRELNQDNTTHGGPNKVFLNRVLTQTQYDQLNRLVPVNPDSIPVAATSSHRVKDVAALNSGGGAAAPAARKADEPLHAAAATPTTAISPSPASAAAAPAAPRLTTDQIIKATDATSNNAYEQRLMVRSYTPDSNLKAVAEETLKLAKEVFVRAIAKGNTWGITYTIMAISNIKLGDPSQTVKQIHYLEDELKTKDTLDTDTKALLEAGITAVKHSLITNEIHAIVVDPQYENKPQECLAAIRIVEKMFDREEDLGGGGGAAAPAAPRRRTIEELVKDTESIKPATDAAHKTHAACLASQGYNPNSTLNTLAEETFEIAIHTLWHNPSSMVQKFPFKLTEIADPSKIIIWIHAIEEDMENYPRLTPDAKKLQKAGIDAVKHSMIAREIHAIVVDPKYKDDTNACLAAIRIVEKMFDREEAGDASPTMTTEQAIQAATHATETVITAWTNSRSYNPDSTLNTVAEEAITAAKEPFYSAIALDHTPITRRMVRPLLYSQLTDQAVVVTQLHNLENAIKTNSALKPDIKTLLEAGITTIKQIVIARGIHAIVVNPQYENKPQECLAAIRIVEKMFD